ncbi:MAG: hypothetical protein K940chlam7_01200 [Chlamydiae bacterium]|nr:hypothetical protein [Chlamydiota bacterium]
MLRKRLNLFNFDDRICFIVGLSIVAGLVLTLTSVLELCTSSCSEGHKYRMLGMSFGSFGMIFFVALGFIHTLSQRFEILSFTKSLLFASALGGEMMFIIVQKYYIGAWCPVCLGIAACVAVGSCALGYSYIKKHRTLIRNENKGETMKSLYRGLTSTAAVFIGFVIAFLGVAKYDPLEAAQNSIKETLAFGDSSSDIEVYLFTDWACPACRKLEPNLQKMAEACMKEAKFIFVDHVVHPETLNFLPFHLSFLLNNKPKYFQLRQMLTEISETTGAPTEDEIETSAAQLGVTYNELNYSDVALGIKYFTKLGEKFKIKGTPTMVIINREAKKGKKLTGNKEITKDNALKAIETLKSL